MTNMAIKSGVDPETFMTEEQLHKEIHIMDPPLSLFMNLVTKKKNYEKNYPLTDFYKQAL
jgi:hypothetical protein